MNSQKPSYQTSVSVRSCVCVCVFASRVHCSVNSSLLVNFSHFFLNVFLLILFALTMSICPKKPSSKCTVHSAHCLFCSKNTKFIIFECILMRSVPFHFSIIFSVEMFNFENLAEIIRIRNFNWSWHQCQV